MGYRKILSVLWLVVVLTGAGVAQAAPDPREMSAREAFGAGRYQDALELFAKLYAENLNPVYLRNIGRCYQNLGEPDRAISSFREYLRKGKNIKKPERAEIEGYISEMEQLKKTQEAERSAAFKTAPPATTVVAPGPTAGSGPTETKAVITERDLAAPKPMSSPPPAIEMNARPAPEPEESHPVYTRWWFWAIVGGVVAAGVGGAAAAGVFTKKNDASCTGICK
jgi:hypothetical protein